ncbi:SARP family transcriptional regulator [Amycolatopsis mediterranei S699]|uniref:SARP family transcriptional regulator n=3 Tax=Amycolatopsis mediterranei TaxID=33910 RepID=A0A0H3D372_AMYMU|nr:BTAD domain-containing putative transcriptional regulator [Amycolatopsis mediterranei]AGT84245.1 SARP family transcriptional regulator [Amycolatopsis mediterranei RB]ADJ45405.1 SARP family transcriptional regulator [Amycolatopsis mediterranei U32]AEK42170.1 SARP family transcriptional regulator [Amycolatopsis mediterranei S699]AFO77117.1 SARP family transcriptional regulator [Amycolatopsis mediterranei S699]KDO05984.1 SARP family transcriptional regulator [Amycolatopsis mediterranei]
MQVGEPEQRVDPGPPRQRCVLAALLVDAGRLVTWEILIDRVWGDAPPSGARHSLYSHVARVRQVLAQVTLPDARPEVMRKSGGYRLEVDPALVDLHRFQDLVSRAHRLADSDPRKAASLRAALGLWRGEPLMGLDGPWSARTRAVWQQQHLDVSLAWAQAELAIGRADAVIGPLTELVADHPTVEPAMALLMRALSDTGRDAEALSRYATARRLLAEELGTEPGPELRDVHRTILRGQRSRSTPPSVASAALRQLPVPARGFAGRTAELARLDVVLAEVGQPDAVVVATLSGMAGVGKTTLALQWAHRVADRFPDGQLYLNLRGYDPGNQVVNPADALRVFLAALGVPAERIPAPLEERTALYRSLVARRRVLVLLDNARNAEQVRPLLPGSSGCLAVVTSRDQLFGLTVSEAAHPVVLTPLPVAEARQLLTNRLGDVRVATEPTEVDEIISLCGRLPIALAVVAARAATNDGFKLAAIAGELRESEAVLDVLSGGDPATDVRAVFSWSYQGLSDPAARLFRLLALHPGPQIGVRVAASLCGLPPARVRTLLAELAHAHLVVEHSPCRFALHDLLRAFATELARTAETAPARRAATLRMLDHYVLATRAADAKLYPRNEVVAVAEPAGGVVGEDFGTDTEALDWLTHEHPALVAVADVALDAGLDSHVWLLAWSLSTFRDRKGHWQEHIAAHHRATAAAHRLGNQTWQARAHHQLGLGYTRILRHDEAHTHLARALDLFGALADHQGQAAVHFTLGHVCDRLGRARDALHHAQQCHDLYRAAADLTGQARAANALGLWHSNNGYLDAAIGYCERSVRLHHEAGDHSGAALALDSLAQAHARLGRHAMSIAHYQQARALLRNGGSPYLEAVVSTNLGEAHHANGDHDAAVRCWSDALVVLDKLGHPNAIHVRGLIDGAIRAQDARRDRICSAGPGTERIDRKRL